MRPLPAGFRETIALSFNQEATVTESYIPEFSFAHFIADLGGSLGLWLGVGAVQIISSGATAVIQAVTAVGRSRSSAVGWQRSLGSREGYNCDVIDH